jgi:hypothetical protein
MYLARWIAPVLRATSSQPSGSNLLMMDHSLAVWLMPKSPSLIDAAKSP